MREISFTKMARDTARLIVWLGQYFHREPITLVIIWVWGYVLIVKPWMEQ